MTSSTTRVLTVEIPTALADKIDQMADHLERSHDWVISRALSTWIAREEERDHLTREALDDVDAGHTTSHQTVHAWADSLNTDNPLPIPH